MSVYVKNLRNEPLMPCSEQKARKLLKQNKATVIEIRPFTIQLLVATGETTQAIILGIDSGYMNIGFSAITEKKELICGEVKLLKGMKDRLAERASYRRTRRSRLRYRKARWNNRVKQQGWLAPSIKHKLDSHIKFIGSIYKILPITSCSIEVASFDIQKMKDENISGVEYQQGEMMGFWNIREYVLHRDNHKCQNPNCQNKVKEKILEVHHIKFKHMGGTDSPNNLIALCNKCHTSPNHKQGKFLYDWCTEGKKVRGFKDTTFMNIVRWRLINQLKDLYPNINATYGYITKNHRIGNKIEKSHVNDAFCIAKGISQKRNKTNIVEQIRRNNRSLEKFYDAKYIDIRTSENISGGYLNNGRRTRNKNLNSENLHQYRGEKILKGQRRIRTKRYFYQPNDLVIYEGKTYTVKGSQNYGKYIALKEIKKVPSVKSLAPYMFSKGLVYTSY